MILKNIFQCYIIIARTVLIHEESTEIDPVCCETTCFSKLLCHVFFVLYYLYKFDIACYLTCEIKTIYYTVSFLVYMSGMNRNICGNGKKSTNYLTFSLLTPKYSMLENLTKTGK